MPTQFEDPVESNPMEPNPVEPDSTRAGSNSRYERGSDGELDRVDTLIRVLYTLLFFLVIRVVEAAIGVIVFFQLVFALITNSTPNPAVTTFARRIIEYGYQIGHYLTYNRDQPPFPFDELPKDNAG